MMLTKNKNPKVNYVSRLLVLPLAAIVIFAFTIKVKNENDEAKNSKTPLKSVVILNSTTKNLIQDTIPPMYYQNKKVAGLQVKSKTNKIKVTYADGTSEMISKKEANKRGFALPPPPPPVRIYDGKKVHSIEGISDQKAIVHFQDGTQKTITREEAKKAGFILFTPPKIAKDNVDEKAVNRIPDNALIFINGKETTKSELKDIPVNTIKSITILKDTSGQLKYGQKGKNGVIEIITKNKNGNVTKVNTDSKTVNSNSLSEQKDTTPKLQLISKVFTKTEIAASFPGGQEAWIKYITQQIRASLDSFTKADYGTCVVRFVVGLDGSVIGAEATTMKGTHLAKVAVNAIKNGPKWIPAKQNGHDVAAYRLQPVTLANPDKLKNNSIKSDQATESTSQITATGNKEVFLKLEESKVFLKLKQPAK